jgi:N-acetylmuramic acid 6-phosphate (MurNAc-6-P) etherase
MLSSVDDDICARLGVLAEDTRLLDQAANAVKDVILGRGKIYIYGCGATGRLAKQMESAFWRPFWRRARTDAKIWPRLAAKLSASVDADLIGEMTGADRALISSLEGFEDLPLIGRLQLKDRGIKKGDVVICVTEGGETSSVIGTILAAHDEWRAAPGYDPEASRRSLYFVYNNPDDRLFPLERSRRVLDEPGITKINLTTGPQAITGSTRLQATTIETYVLGTVLEAALHRALGTCLAPGELARLGMEEEFVIGEKLREFSDVLAAVRTALPDLARLTDLEAATYGEGRYTTYFAGRGLITVFIDSTERSPTFRLFPLDTVQEPRRRCWIQVWSESDTIRGAWQVFLGRPFRGLDPDFYRAAFDEDISDPYLRRSALESLKKAGDDQQDLYDFSFSTANREIRGPRPGDLGVMVCLSPEEKDAKVGRDYFGAFMNLCARNDAALAVLLVTDQGSQEATQVASAAAASFKGAHDLPIIVPVLVPTAGDPFALKQQIAAKILLNAHSTAVMAKLGKVIGNTMTNVSPSNLKLIGRATYLIQSHVNDALGQPAWVKSYGKRNPITYGEANAVLFDAIAFLKDKAREAGQTAEVAFSIIRILESWKARRGVTRAEALEIVKGKGLSAYLAGFR